MTISYDVTSLSKLLSLYPQDEVSEILSSFSCNRDKDVESFLREKAIAHEKRHLSRTYLIYTAGDSPEPLAYFTVAVNSIDVTGMEFSNTLRKKMNVNNNLAQSYLIGQIGKRDGCESGLGKYAVVSAMEAISVANSKVGCRVVRIDCKPSLINYYNNNGFVHIGRDKDRNLDQMVCIIG